MEVWPENKLYGDILESSTDAEAAFAASVDEKKVIVKSDSHDALKKLQDDLRKAGYRKIFK